MFSFIRLICLDSCICKNSGRNRVDISTFPSKTILYSISIFDIISTKIYKFSIHSLVLKLTKDSIISIFIKMPFLYSMLNCTHQYALDSQPKQASVYSYTENKQFHLTVRIANCRSRLSK